MFATLICSSVLETKAVTDAVRDPKSKVVVATLDTVDGLEVVNAGVVVVRRGIDVVIDGVEVVNNG